MTNSESIKRIEFDSERAGEFHLQFKYATVIGPKLNLTSKIVKNVGRVQEKKNTLQVERLGERLLDIPEEIEQQLSNWIETQKKNQSTMNQLQEKISRTEKQLENDEQLKKNVPKNSDEFRRLDNQISEHKMLLTALQNNLNFYKMEEFQLLKKQITVKIQLQQKEIDELNFQLNKIEDKSSQECKSLLLVVEEKETLLQSLNASLKAIDPSGTFRLHFIFFVFPFSSIS